MVNSNETGFTTVQIVLIVGMVVFILSACSGVIALGYWNITSGAVAPKWLPDSLKYETLYGHRMVGSTIEEKSDITLQNCLKACDDNSECMSVTYKESNKKCFLNHQNRESAPGTVSEWSGNDYYGKQDVYSRFPVEKQGWMDPSGLSNNTYENTSNRDCLLKCVARYKDGCKGFNYDNNKKLCQLVPIKYAGNHLFFDVTQPSYTFYSIK